MGCTGPERLVQEAPAAGVDDLGNGMRVAGQGGLRPKDEGHACLLSGTTFGLMVLLGQPLM
jgi:hypothetical protein